jgi:hypothetical protein
MRRRRGVSWSAYMRAYVAAQLSVARRAHGTAAQRAHPDLQRAIAGSPATADLSGHRRLYR